MIPFLAKPGGMPPTAPPGGIRLKLRIMAIYKPLIKIDFKHHLSRGKLLPWNSFVVLRAVVKDKGYELGDVNVCTGVVLEEGMIQQPLQVGTAFNILLQPVSHRKNMH